MAKSGAGRALEVVRSLPRVALNNLKDNPGARKKDYRRGRGQHGGGMSGRGMSGQGMRGTKPRVGFEGGQTPFYLRVPKYPYYKDHHLRRQYVPVTLTKLQHLIDMGRIDPDQPIDATSLVNSGAFEIKIMEKQYGINLIEEGLDNFAAQINIEVQHISELAIAAIEKCGGIVTSGFYDPISLDALAYPLQFFQQGKPIPRRALPPKDLVTYYANASYRGYLADPDKVHQARADLAQKHGYLLPDLTSDPKREMLRMRKDPRQIFFGLQPGWFVNLSDRTVLKPIDEDLQEYYKS
ncbi:39S ribosomal protein L15, mitochondrial [Strongylocentrotus purpuratus]|uniref:Large ribosomal subunit protein uL15m n=1 Tax=Strongylocentrotus purpuratus TaxID=7668 RepID=A0A7M7RED4_STRPU|nr:39S ribosomal protein L15, mitochondrial [Strongylocentrotus purpuratus]|eukprot:XP_786658.2 PREDICTED: 39S ribosomal protein L15, mitochondrial isoform X1 [Strongylocentrotus purpuratus]